MRNNIFGGKNRFINIFIVSKNWSFCLRMSIRQPSTKSGSQLGLRQSIDWEVQWSRRIKLSLGDTVGVRMTHPARHRRARERMALGSRYLPCLRNDRRQCSKLGDWTQGDAGATP
jgi:hypothetical protein